MRMKQGDLYPFEYVLTYDDGTIFDLSGCTVTLTMTLDNATTPTVDDEDCVIVTPSAGIVRYTWNTGETDAVGMYKIEFHVTTGTGSTVTVPSGDIIWMFIVPSLRTVITP